MSEQSTTIISKVWGLCNPLRDDGVSYGDYLEQLTYLIFLKMSDEYSKPPYKRDAGIPAGYGWSDMNMLKGAELEDQYKATLEKLGEQSGILGQIFKGAVNKISNAAILYRVVQMIDKEKWVAMSSDVKGEIYFDEHKKKRLDITDAQRRGKIQEGRTLLSLRKLRSIDILSVAKLTDLENELSDLKVCFELTPEELKSSPVCPHCHFHLDDNVKPVYGKLDNIEARLDALLDEWTKSLLNTISDPIVASQKEYLSAEQQKVIDAFIETKELPKRVDDFFIKAIQALLKGFEPVVVDADDLIEKLTKLPPLDETSFRQKVNDLIAGYTRGKDAGKLRIIVKK